MEGFWDDIKHLKVLKWILVIGGGLIAFVGTTIVGGIVQEKEFRGRLTEGISSKLDELLKR